MRVDVIAMCPAFGKDVDPEIFQNQLAIIQLKFQILGEGGHVLVQHFHQIRKDWEPPRQIAERGIRSIARIVVLFAPVVPGVIIFCDHKAGLLQFLGIDCGGVLGQGGTVKAGHKERVDLGHSPAISPRAFGGKV